MIFCAQKHQHCFVACCASLLGKNDVAFQEKIVADYPKDLRHGMKDEGVPATSVEINNIVIGLNLSSNPQYVVSTIPSYSPISDFLKVRRNLAGKAFIFTRQPTNHSVVIKEIHDNKLV